MWSSETSDPALKTKSQLSNLKPLMYTLPVAELQKLDAALVDVNLLASLDSKLSFPQVRI